MSEAARPAAPARPAASARPALSPRQADVLDYIVSVSAQRGLPPSYREIGDALGISSTNGVADHVNALVKKGFLKKLEGGLARGLQVTQKAKPQKRESVVAVPVVGRVAAGTPILADENYEKTLHLDRSLVPGTGPVFALRVSGESMIDDGIHDGDFVIARQTDAARNGDIVVALVDGDATVKRYFRESGRIRLQPANERMKPIFVDASNDVSVQGVVVGVFRSYAA